MQIALDLACRRDLGHMRVDLHETNQSAISRQGGKVRTHEVTLVHIELCVDKKDEVQVRF